MARRGSTPEEAVRLRPVRFTEEARHRGRSHRARPADRVGGGRRADRARRRPLPLRRRDAPRVAHPRRLRRPAPLVEVRRERPARVPRDPASPRDRPSDGAAVTTAVALGLVLLALERAKAYRRERPPALLRSALPRDETPPGLPTTPKAENGSQRRFAVRRVGHTSKRESPWTRASTTAPSGGPSPRSRSSATVAAAPLAASSAAPARRAFTPTISTAPATRSTSPTSRPPATATTRGGKLSAALSSSAARRAGAAARTSTATRAPGRRASVASTRPRRRTVRQRLPERL